MGYINTKHLLQPPPHRVHKKINSRWYNRHKCQTKTKASRKKNQKNLFMTFSQANNYEDIKNFNVKGKHR